MRENKDFRNFYEIGKSIVNEGYGVIYEGKDKENGELRAIKVFDKKKIRADFMNDNLKELTEEEMKIYDINFYNEMNNMKIIQGNNKENINTVKFYEYFNNKDEFVIVMELWDDNLLNYFAQKKGPFNSNEIYNILTQLNNSFKIMNQNNLIHRDITLENILIKYQNDKNYIYKLKLTQNSCLKDDISSNNSLYNMYANVKMMAPEVLKEEKYTEKCDLWSLGILIYVLYFKKFPFLGNNNLKILEQIQNFGQQSFEKTDNSDLDDLIQKILIEDPQKRLTWDQYFAHSFFLPKKSNNKTIIEINEDYHKYYDIIDRIGTGSFGVVYKAKKKDTNEERAIKVFDKENIRANIRNESFREPSEEEMKSYTDSLIHEIENMKIVQNINEENENTVKFYDCYNNNDEFAIVMELCDASLMDIFTKREDPYNIEEIKGILIQLNHSFRIMNENKLVHRDLKLQNILVKYDKDKTIMKLTDYGLSKQLLSISKKFSTLVGTLTFMAPEIIKKEKYNEKCDLWSLGVIIYILCFKDYPYKGKTEIEILKAINKLDKSTMKKTGNANLDDLISHLLIEDQSKRMTWKEYFNHPFFTNSVNSDFIPHSSDENYILIKLKVEEKDRNKDIYFLGKNGEEQSVNDDLNETNCKLFINNIENKFNKCFKPDNAGEYEIKISFINKINNCSYMFCRCNKITSIDLSFFDSSIITDMSYMFSECYNLIEVNLTHLNTENVFNMNYMFNKCYEIQKIIFPESFNTQKVENMSFMFHNCQNLQELNFSSSFKTNNVTNMRTMFGKCFKIKKLDLSNYNTENVKDMSYMFDQCNNLEEIIIDPKFVTENIIYMGHMFSDCYNLKKIDLSSFNTQKVKYMSYMFSNCQQLTNIDLSKSKINKETNLFYMFKDCVNLRKINISLFDINDSNKKDGIFENLKNVEKIIVNKSYIEKYKNIFYEIKNKFSTE